jgi:hypothetical protein
MEDLPRGLIGAPGERAFGRMLFLAGLAQAGWGKGERREDNQTERNKNNPERC